MMFVLRITDAFLQKARSRQQEEVEAQGDVHGVVGVGKRQQIGR